DLLGEVEDSSKRQIKDLPSWVPDWSTLPIKETYLSIPYSASGVIDLDQPRILAEANGQNLTIWGTKFTSLSSAKYDDRVSVEFTSLAVIREYMRWMASGLPPIYPRTGE